MVKINYLVILLLLNGFCFAKTPTAKVLSLSGNCYFMDVATQIKSKLIKNQLLYEGFMIQTGKNSEVVLEFDQGIKKYIPANSQFGVLDSKTLELYKKSNQSLNQYFQILGTKAAGPNESKEESFSLSCQKAFEKKEFLQFLLLEKQLIQKQFTPEILYQFSYAFLKIGDFARVSKYLKLLKEQNPYEYRDFILFSTFILFLQNQKYEEAQKLFETTKPETYSYPIMENLLKEFEAGKP